MSDPGVARTTVSIDRDIYLLALKRMRTLGYRKFSRFVEALLERDVRERGSLVIVKEESPQYPNQTQVLRTRQDHLPKSADRTRPKGRRASSRRNRSPKAPQDTQD